MQGKQIKPTPRTETPPSAWAGVQRVGWRILAMAVMLLNAAATLAQVDTDRVLAMARNAIGQGDHALAISQLNSVISGKPHLHEPYYYRGVAKFYLEDWEGAATDCTEAIERNPYFSKPYELRGLARINQKRFHEAVADYTKAVELDSESPHLWQNLSLCLLETDSAAKADSVIDKVIRRWPKQAKAYTIKAQIKLETQDTIQAEALIDSALAIAPAPASVTAKAILLARRGEWEEAVKHYTQALRLDPQHTDALTGRAICHYKLNNLRAAMDDYTRAIRADSLDLTARYNRALLRADVGEDNLAIDDFSAVISADPANMMATFNRATLLHRIGQLPAAIADYTTVISHHPQFLQGYQLRAQALREAGRIRAALADEEYAIQLEASLRYGTSAPTGPQSASLPGNPDELIDDQGSRALGVSSVQTAEQKHTSSRTLPDAPRPEFLTPPTAVLTLYREAGRVEAVQTFQQALVHARQGRTAEAIRDFTRSIEAGGQFGEAYYNRAVLTLEQELAQDGTSAALRDLSKAGELGVTQAYTIIRRVQNR